MSRIFTEEQIREVFAKLAERIHQCGAPSFMVGEAQQKLLGQNTTRKVTLTIDDDAYQVLLQLQKASNASSLAEVLRNAVGLLDWARIQCAEGLTVGAFKDGSPSKELVLPFPKKV